MRIIAGEYKGRKLDSPQDNNIRPTSDKVKEAIFSILMPYIEDAVFVDLFSGSGGLGLEAISRGAKYSYFCDKERKAITLIKANIEKCHAEDYSCVVWGDYMKLLNRLSKKEVDIFVLDPPYLSGLYEKALNSIDSLDLLKDEGIIIAEHVKEIHLPESIGNLSKIKERTYGRSILSIYKKVYI